MGATIQETRSTCPYCGVGCGVIIETRNQQIVGVRGDTDHPANRGRLCSKGSTLHLSAASEVQAQVRLLQPLHRLERNTTPQAIGWDAALDLAAARVGDIIARDGPDAMGFYVSGQLLTEDYYVFNKLVKGLIGSNNIDSNSRLCMSSAVAGYKQSFGADAPPACYEDIEQTDCLFIAGSNTAFAHPVLFRRVEDARKARPDMKVIVVDPRRTETAHTADLHLAIQPGSDVMLFHGMLHLMLWEGWTRPAYIEAHTEGFEALRAVVREATPERVSRICGISEADLLTATRWFACSPATLSMYCQGLNQSTSGTAKNTALINLHLAAGQLGRVGAGPFSLTGQPNAMGGREVGGMANLLSAHRDLSNAQHRAEVAALWGVERVPSAPGKTAVEMFEAAADGQIKGLWIACTNPAQSMPDQTTVRAALRRAEFVVVQEAYLSASTCDFADLVLPASTWGEKEGTVTNSERRISRVRAAIPAPGLARPDWRIASDFGQRLASRLGRPELLPYDTPESIWNEHRASTLGRDLDIGGLSYQLLDHAGPQQWPYPAGASTGRQRLYEDGVFPTPSGRARFVATHYRPPAEPRDARYPFSLNTGRLRDQWHGMTRTGTVARLMGHAPEPSIALNAQDIRRLGLADGQLVHVTSRRASVILPVQPAPEVALTQAFIPMHWGSETLGGRSTGATGASGINSLTLSAFCPDSKQPELKHAAVKILAAELPWSYLAMAWIDAGRVLAVREALRHEMPAFDFASCVVFGRERQGVQLRAAAYEPVDPEVLDRIEAWLGMSGDAAIRYSDQRRARSRVMRLSGANDAERLDAFVLAGDASAQIWIRPLLLDQGQTRGLRRLLLATGSRTPLEPATRSRQICTCLDVKEDAVLTCAAGLLGDEETRLSGLQSRLRCGTQCGSCVPELRRLLRQGAPTPA